VSLDTTANSVAVGFYVFAGKNKVQKETTHTTAGQNWPGFLVA